MVAMSSATWTRGFVALPWLILVRFLQKMKIAFLVCPLMLPELWVSFPRVPQPVASCVAAPVEELARALSLELSSSLSPSQPFRTSLLLPAWPWAFRLPWQACLRRFCRLALEGFPFPFSPGGPLSLPLPPAPPLGRSGCRWRIGSLMRGSGLRIGLFSLPLERGLR